MKPDHEAHGNETAGAIRARLQTLEEEVRCLTDLAAREEEETRRLQYWDLARDLQAEVRAIRSLLAQLPTAPESPRDPILRRALKALGLRMEAAAARI